jgi:pimeloyl-ACP methyl ester carboxylesterase
MTADPQALARELAHGREGRQAHIVEHAGHWVQYEGAATINRLLVEFLAVPAGT